MKRSRWFDVSSWPQMGLGDVSLASMRLKDSLIFRVYLALEVVLWSWKASLSLSFLALTQSLLMARTNREIRGWNPHKACLLSAMFLSKTAIQTEFLNFIRTAPSPSPGRLLRWFFRLCCIFVNPVARASTRKS